MTIGLSIIITVSKICYINVRIKCRCKCRYLYNNTYDFRKLWLDNDAMPVHSRTTYVYLNIMHEQTCHVYTSNSILKLYVVTCFLRGYFPLQRGKCISSVKITYHCKYLQILRKLYSICSNCLPFRCTYKNSYKCVRRKGDNCY